MFTIAICDDNKQDCSNLCNMVEQYFCGKQKIELHSFQSGLVLYQFMKSQNVHLVIMDIMLDNQSGIDIVKQLKYIAPDCKIIFVSINPEYFQDVYYVDHLQFLVKPIEEGHDAESGLEHISKKKITQSMLFGCGIGWICGFTGSGGGILMLTVFTLHLGYNLKVAVGTSTMIMTLVALTGTVSHISMGATVEILPTLLVVICCVIGAYVSAKFANKCEIKKLNKVVGTCLGILGVITILLKLI